MSAAWLVLRIFRQKICNRQQKGAVSYFSYGLRFSVKEKIYALAA